MGCINLVEYLPITDQHNKREVEPIPLPILSDDGKLSFRTKLIKKSIDSVAQWLAAWYNYEYLIVSHTPDRYADLSKYRDFIMKSAQKFQWYAVYAYDCRFRAQLSQASDADLATIDTDLYTTVFDITSVRRDVRSCQRCRDHMVSDCPFPATDQTEKKTSMHREPPRFRNKEVCNNFNAGMVGFPHMSVVWGLGTLLQVLVSHCRRTHFSTAQHGRYVSPPTPTVTLLKKSSSILTLGYPLVTQAPELTACTTTGIPHIATDAWSTKHY